MNILLLTPGINRKYNDNYYAYKHIADKGHTIIAVSNRENLLKGGGVELSPETETDGNILIFRLFKTADEQRLYHRAKRKYRMVRSIAEKYKPDVIFCENATNMRLAGKLGNDLGIPVVLRIEILYDGYDPGSLLGFRKYVENPVTGDLVAKVWARFFWRWILRRTRAVITCYHGDKEKTKKLEKKGRKCFYIPWPCKESTAHENAHKEKGRGVFIGAFDRHKNLIEFENTIPELFANTHIKEFIFVGDGEYSCVVENLCAKFPGKVRWVKSMTREECLKLIADSFICYSPAVWGGWGFIGDAWAMKTPLLVKDNHYDFKDYQDSISVNVLNITACVNRLYENQDFYNRIVENGYQRFKTNHSAEKVGEEYLKVCSSVVNNGYSNRR